ncbi:MAG TPA: 5-oxoprolinase subunit PxpB [Terriglobales bacterium]
MEGGNLTPEVGHESQIADFAPIVFLNLQSFNLKSALTMLPARFQPASDQSLLIYFGHAMSRKAHQQVMRLLRLLQADPVAGIVNLHPAYHSLLIKFDPLQFAHADLESILRERLKHLADIQPPPPRQIEIPVCYDEEFGPDLNHVAAMQHLTPEQVIELHASKSYEVYFLGFVPGFAYLGELAPELVTPRLPAPRRSVASGSVGIAGSQTGVYPFAVPGGWRLLGRTPLKMFQPQTATSLLSIGDRVRFVPITREQFAQLEKA